MPRKRHEGEAAKEDDHAYGSQRHPTITRLNSELWSIRLTCSVWEGTGAKAEFASQIRGDAKPDHLAVKRNPDSYDFSTQAMGSPESKVLPDPRANIGRKLPGSFCYPR